LAGVGTDNEVVLERVEWEMLESDVVAAYEIEVLSERWWSLLDLQHSEM
jgi:hypothetical protein